MNSSDAEGERFVLPQWLLFRDALAQGELFSSANKTPLIDLEPSRRAFKEALEAFRESPSPFLASDLMGVAVRLGEFEIAKELAEYVVHQQILGGVAIGQAREILGDVVAEAQPTLTANAKIRQGRAWLHRFPMDAIAWIEQARLYTIIGQKRPAERAVERALSVAPNDRFVVRAAVRFFIHQGDWNRANKIAGTAAKVTNDPWLVGLWISTGSQLGKVPSKFKTFFSNAMAASDHFHHSELLEACSTEEMRAGSHKKAKHGFRRAWIQPPKTVITHGQWVLREKMPELASSTSIDFAQSSEAMSWIGFMRLDLRSAAESAREWALEEPFSSKPFMHGSFLDSLREHYQEAEAMANEGLRANPGHHGLTNNLAFALIGQGRLDDASALLLPIPREFHQMDDVGLVATWGLLRMKQGAHAEGRKHYARAIEQANKQNDPKLALRAILNLLIAEIDTGGVVQPEILASAAEAVTKYSDARVVVVAAQLKRRLDINQSLSPTQEEKEALAKFDKAVAASARELQKIVPVSDHVSPPK